MITNEHIHIKLKEAIKNSELSQSEIARALKIKQPTVAQYISGKVMPSLETFANLCVILDLDPADALCLDKFEEK